MLKILMVISEVPPVASGVSRVADRLTRGLSGLGHQIDVISLEDVPRFVRGEVRISSMLWKAPQVLWSRLDGYDIVHIHGPAPTFSDIALLLSAGRRSYGGPLVVYTHIAEIALPARRSSVLTDLYNWTHKHMARLADQVIVSTPAYARDLSQFLPAERIAIVPWGVDSGWSSGDVPKADRFTVLLVGQLRPYKGLETLFRAVERIPDIDVQIIGNGYRESYYRELAARSSLEHVTFRGRVTDAELVDAYTKAHALVLPSTTRQEAFGLVLLEGMVAGCVPIVSRLPGITDVVGDAGFSFPVGDEAALASLLVRLRDDPELRHAYSRRARERARRFSWQGTVNSHHAIYQRLMTLRHFDSALEAGEEENPSLEGLLHDTIATMDASSGSIMLLEPRRQMLQVAASSGLPTAIAHNGGQPLGQGIAGFVAARNVPLMLPEAFARLNGHGPVGFTPRTHIHSSLSVPMRAGNCVLGVMNLSSHIRERRFRQEDLHWLCAHARRVAHLLAKHARRGAAGARRSTTPG